MRRAVSILLLMVFIGGGFHGVASGGWEESDSRIYIYRLWDNYAELGEQINRLQGILRDDLITEYNTTLYRTRENFWLLEQQVLALFKEIDNLEKQNRNLESENRRLRGIQEELRGEILSLREENESLQERVQQYEDADEEHLFSRLEEKELELVQLIEELEDENARNKTLITKIGELEDENKDLLRTISDLKRAEESGEGRKPPNNQ